MASSFVEHESSDANAQFHAIENDLPKNVIMSHDSQSSTDIKSEELAGTVLLAAGNGNVTKVLPGSNTQEFILNEVDHSLESRTSGKRKREQSPDIYVKETIEETAESEGSYRESDAEENTSVVVVTPCVDYPSGNTNDNSSEKKRNFIDDDLPDTVTLLKTSAGASVYLVGTAHFSIESQEDVAKIIRAVQPHVVLVELCKARVNILQLDENTILEEAKNINFEKIHSTIKQNGLFHGLMYILLLSMSAHITKQLGMAPGGEFRRAFAEAKEFPHCIVHLGDRPIHVTLQRALSALSWWQTVRVTWHLIMSKGPISVEEVERCKRRDLLEEMLAEMTGEFPDMSTVFVKERDIYLTHSLQLAAAIGLPSERGFRPPRVVGVVGIGHVPGIVQHWGKVRQEDIPPLLHIPPPTLTSRIVRVGAKLSLVGLVLWGCSRILPISKVYPKLSEIKTVVQNVFQ